jgi:hypothetical protein
MAKAKPTISDNECFYLECLEYSNGETFIASDIAEINRDTINSRSKENSAFKIKHEAIKASSSQRFIDAIKRRVLERQQALLDVIRNRQEAGTGTAFEIDTACKIANISPRTHRFWMLNDEEYREKIQHLRELCLDKIEGELVSKALEGDFKAQVTFLYAKAANRGYIRTPRNEVLLNVKTQHEESLNELDAKGA